MRTLDASLLDDLDYKEEDGGKEDSVLPQLPYSASISAAAKRNAAVVGSAGWRQ